MAAAPPVFSAPSTCFTGAAAASSALKFHHFTRVSFISNRLNVIKCQIYNPACKNIGFKSPSRAVRKFPTFASDGEAVGAQTETQEKDPPQEPESEIEENTYGAVDVDSSSESEDTVLEKDTFVVVSSLNLYKEALTNNDSSKIVEVESVLKTIEEEKMNLEGKVATLFL